jgi:aminoglycoside phosphotransferase (APT) family kinase protein
VRIDEDLVVRLIEAQFPRWADLHIQAVSPGGWDNRTFRLGEDMLVRLPSAAAYAAQVEREKRWLPRLVAHLPVPIPTPLAKGEPSADYPWPWSIFTWLDGEPVASGALEDPATLARDLADFLRALERIDPVEGPSPGPDNFFRGGNLRTYDSEVRRAIDVLGKSQDVVPFTAFWNEARATAWSRPPVWVHGDFSGGNLLVSTGHLCGVIDFGQCVVGDPACDLAIAWTLFDAPAREVFRTALGLDAGTWARGRAWAIWKALIVAAGFIDTNAVEKARASVTLQAVLADRGL